MVLLEIEKIKWPRLRAHPLDYQRYDVGSSRNRVFFYVFFPPHNFYPSFLLIRERTLTITPHYSSRRVHRLSLIRQCCFPDNNKSLIILFLLLFIIVNCYRRRYPAVLIV